MTLSLKLAAASTDLTLPKSYSDAILNVGTAMLFDFLRGDSNPNADGALPTTAVFKDLSGGPDAVIAAGSNSRITQNAGRQGLTWPGNSGVMANVDAVSFGLTQRFYPNKPFVFGLWIKIPTGAPTANYGRFIWKSNGLSGGTANTSQIWMDSGIGGVRPRGLVSDGVSGQGPGGSADQTRNAVHHIAFSFIPSNEMRLFWDGAQVGIQNANVPATLQELPSDPTILNMSGLLGTAYRVWAELTAVSGRTAAAAVAAEYAANSARFV